MKQGLVFHKVCASGNDFVALDGRRKVIPGLRGLARKLCDRHRGIGADGLLVVEKARKADLRMRIFNADGSEAEMCANGLQCVTLWANQVLKLPKKLKIETLAGIQCGEVKSSERVEIRLADPTDFRSESPIKAGDETYDFFFVNTGVPHAVIFTDMLTLVPVKSVGSQIRFHPHFQPAGTNVNFVQVTGEREISVRTYERGVEDETLSCGTGVTASAIVSVLEGLCKEPVRVKTQSGEVLKVSFDHDSHHVANVRLEGQAQIVFEGVWKK